MYMRMPVPPPHVADRKRRTLPLWYNMPYQSWRRRPPHDAQCSWAHAASPHTRRDVFAEQSMRLSAQPPHALATYPTPPDNTTHTGIARRRARATHHNSCAPHNLAASVDALPRHPNTRCGGTIETHNQKCFQQHTAAPHFGPAQPGPET